MKRIYTVYSIVWLLVAVFIGALISSAGSAPSACGQQQLGIEE